MIEAQKMFQQTGDKKYEFEIAKNHNIQLARKLSLNSAYGAIGNQYFRYFDVRHAGRYYYGWPVDNSLD